MSSAHVERGVVEMMGKIVLAFAVGILIFPFFQISLPAEEAGFWEIRANDDAPWPTFHGDPARTGNTTEWGPGTNRMLWSNGTGQNCYSSPAVAGGNVFIGSTDNAVYCFNASTGVRLWRTSTGNMIHSSPAVDIGAGRVYIGSMDHYLYCLNATSGAQLWRNQTGGDLSSSPLLYDGKVYIGCGDWYWGEADGNLYCFNATTGERIWRTADAGGGSSPAIADGQLYSISSNNMHCLDPRTGAFIWNASIGWDYYGSPAVADGMVFCSAGDGNLYCFYASNGTQRWATDSGFSESQSTPAISNGSVYACFDGGDLTPGALMKFHASNGTLIWTYNTAGTPWGGPTVTGDRVYFSNDRTVLCLDTDDRSVIWSYQGAAGDLYGIAGCAALANGRLYIGGAESKIYCFGVAEPNRPPWAVNLAPPHTIRETSVCLQWNQSQEPDFSCYEVHRSALSSFTPDPSTLALNITSRTMNETNITGLSYSTRYYFKIRVWDNGDPPMFNISNEVEATTATPNGVPAAVALYPPSEITPFTMKLAWSASTDADFAHYEVHRGSSRNFTPGASTLLGSIDRRDENSTLAQGMEPWTVYYFKVRVYDNGSPPLRNDSNELDARTGNTPPTAAVLNPVQMGATSASLSWSVSPDEDFARYELHMSQNASFAPDQGTSAANLTDRQNSEYMMENLELARAYYFMVRTFDEGGMQNDSNTVSGTTMNTLPRPVISSPEEGDIYDTRTSVSFNGNTSADQDKDPLSFHWTSSIDGFLSGNACFTAILTEGSHRITLYVNDGSGHNVSARLSITVNRAPDRPPLLAVAFPLENSEISGVATLTGTATDIDGNETLVSVECSVDKGAWTAADGLTAWSFDLNTSRLSNGKHKLAFRAFDGELYSPEINLNVKVSNIIINLKPSIIITGPPTGSALSGTAIITGTASDPENNLARVEMSLNGGGWSAIVGASSWSYPLDTTMLRNGQHSAQFRSFDGTYYSEPAQLNFTVRNAVAQTSQSANPILYVIPVIVIMAAVIAVLVLLRRRRSRGSAAPPPSNPPAMQPPAAQQYPPAAPYQYQQPPAAGGYQPQQQPPPAGYGRYPPPYG
jgi:outer membrane protein assembly factor BamB